MTATFLGTSSGGGPTETRNCSSLVLDVVGDGTLWSILFHCMQWLCLVDEPFHDYTVIDCAEGTLRQFSLQPPKDVGIKASRVNKIFVTHMHRESTTTMCMTVPLTNGVIAADHVMGLPTLLRSILGFPHPEDISSRGTPVSIHRFIYRRTNITVRFAI
jgi:ribonuclease Z